MRIALIVGDVIIGTVLLWAILSWIGFFLSRTSFRWRRRAAYDGLMRIHDVFFRSRKSRWMDDTTRLLWSGVRRTLLVGGLLVVRWLVVREPAPDSAGPAIPVQPMRGTPGVAAQFAEPFLRVLLMVLDVINWIILVWVILSWIVFFMSQSTFRLRHRGFYGILMQLNDIFTRMAHPFLKPFRRMLRRFDTAGIDWSPLLLWITIILIRALLEGVYRAILIG